VLIVSAAPELFRLPPHLKQQAVFPISFWSFRIVDVTALTGDASMTHRLAT
jgi:hypothetical protein